MKNLQLWAERRGEGGALIECFAMGELDWHKILEWNIEKCSDFYLMKFLWRKSQISPRLDGQELESAPVYLDAKVHVVPFIQYLWRESFIHNL